MLLQPRKTKYKKSFKGRIYGLETKANQLIFGSVGLKSLEIGRITSKQIEATRRVISRKLKRLGKVDIRIFPYTPISRKPIEVRMGKGKGAVDFWVAKVKPGQILFEIQGIKDTLCISTLKSAAQKLPVNTKIVTKER